VVDFKSDSEYCERSLTRANAALIAGEYEYVIGASSGLSLNGAPIGANSKVPALAKGARLATSISRTIEKPLKRKYGELSELLQALGSTITQMQ